MAKDRGFEDDAGTPRVPKTPTKATATKGGTTSPSKKKTAGVKKVKAGVKQEAPEVADEEHGLSPEVYSDQLPKIMEPINGHSTNGHISSLSQTNGSTLKRSRDDFEDEIDDPLALVESKRIKEELGPVLDEPSHFSNGTYGLDGLIGTDLDAPLGVFDVDEPTYFYDAVEDGGLGTSGWTHPL